MKKLFFIACFMGMGSIPTLSFAAGEKLVLSVESLATPYEVTMRNAAVAHAKKIGVPLLALDGQNNSLKQVSDIENAITGGAQAFIVSPNDADAVASGIDAVAAAGLVVVTMDRQANTKHKVPHFGVDFYKGGVLSGEVIKKNFPNGADIIVLTGQLGASSNIDRYRGFMDSLKKGGDKYRIIAEQSGNWFRSEGLRIVESLLPTLPKVPDVIYAMNDDMALGAIEALQTAGYKPGQVFVSGQNADPEALARVRDGWLSVTYDLQQGHGVSVAIDQVLDYLRNKTPIKGLMITPMTITKDNLKEAAQYANIDNY
ncbi:substrate-binding domain-containing protein [Bartonella sp. DGB2]|uniref:substrate-binding domain-containing protein n=1 Tax=Bartonella sp. DGB2 TaxID=3388426 RepID=UPI00398FA344